MKLITKTVQSEVVEVIAYQVFAITMYPTLDEYTAICQALITKYPTLADTIGNGYVRFS